MNDLIEQIVEKELKEKFDEELAYCLKNCGAPESHLKSFKSWLKEKLEEVHRKGYSKGREDRIKEEKAVSDLSKSLDKTRDIYEAV